MLTSRVLLCLAVGLIVFLLGFLPVYTQSPPPRPLNPELLNLTSAGPNRTDEPFAPTASLDKARSFLDDAALAWTRSRKCGTCHTNIAYLVGRSAAGPETPSSREVRRFFEERVTRWDTMGEAKGPYEDMANNKGWGAIDWWPTEVVATAVGLAMNDALGTGKLQPITRQALDRVWTVQREDGAWDWLKADTQPLEADDYYGAAFAALGVSHAPDGYADTPAAVAGLSKLRSYLAHQSSQPLHHRAVLLWAASKRPELMTAVDREQTKKELIALQRPDGGWSLPSLGRWHRKDGTPNDQDAPSDGYATGLAVLVLHSSGLTPADSVLARAISWLKTNQRVSGRWFTRSINRDSYHFISHVGTVYAAMALSATDPGGTRSSSRPDQ
jgi:squalene-hopene/tetraprenyl-beta-curcumene cyclase